MEKLLLIGINTRSIINSALKLDYDIYSASYFSTADTPVIKNQKIILKESDGESCGTFKNQFNSEILLEKSEDFIDEADWIIPVSGVSPDDFSKENQRKILGNHDIGDVEDKLKFYSKIKNEFLTPMTFYVHDMDEAVEINNNHPDIQFILKPLQGSGGYDVSLLNNGMNIDFDGGKFIMQEYVTGVNLSSSVLSTKKDAKSIITSRLLTMNDFGYENDFRYAGNILPLTAESIMDSFSDTDELNNKLMKTGEKLIRKFNLIGSNGVDYILNENGLYVIEVNPRIQGTFECAEKTLGINMLEAHIKACMGKIIEIPKPKYYTYKKIIYSPVRMKYHPMNLNNIYDVPLTGSITEKNEPLLTIIDKSDDFKKLYKKVESTTKIVNKRSKINRQDA